MNPRLKYFFAVAMMLFILTSCHSDDQSLQPSLNENNLKTYSVEIDNTRDTVLQAPGGSLISITAGSFEGTKDRMVRLEIKEALDIVDIVMAGLTTESDGKMLSSGGMIDIEAAAGQNLKIIKPILVSLPTPFIDPQMSVFKGVRGNDGSLNWTNPVPMTTNTQITKLDAGEQLFAAHCASCHGIAKEVTGPALAFMSSLRTQKWLFDYTRNNKKVMTSGDRYANCLYEHYNKTPMPVFPELSDTDLTSLYSYIENESRKERLSLPNDHLKKCVDSCKVYSKIKDSLDEVKWRLLNANAGSDTSTARLSIENIVNDNFPVAPPPMPVVLYQFQVMTFGWYNIDRFCEDLIGLAESRLSAKLTGAHPVKVYLIVPRSRVMQEGSPLEKEKDIYAFHFGEVKLRLPQAVPASVMAVGEEGGQLFFDLVSFTTSTNQTLSLEPKPVSPQVMNEKISRLRLDSYTESIDETKTERALKNMDQLLQSLKPKTCDCNCGIKYPLVDSVSLYMEK